MQFDRFNRREFITLLGGAAAWPLAARAQQPAMPVIGFLAARSPDDRAHFLTAFRQALRNRLCRGPERGDRISLGGGSIRSTAGAGSRSGSPPGRGDRSHDTPVGSWRQGGNHDDPDRLRTGGDPVKLGLVASLNRPGGNVTGINFFTAELGAKRLGLLRELVPGAVRVAVLVNPNMPTTETIVDGVQAQLAHWAANPSPQSHHRPRHRYGLCDPCARAASTRSLLVPTRCSTAVAYSSLRWRPAIAVPAIYLRVSLPKSAG